MRSSDGRVGGVFDSMERGCARSVSRGNNYTSRSGFERVHINHEAVFHVTLEHALGGGVDLVHADHFDVASDVVLAAEIQQLLRLGQPANLPPDAFLSWHLPGC
jgi:hypothetical protein